MLKTTVLFGMTDNCCWWLPGVKHVKSCLVFHQHDTLVILAARIKTNVKIKTDVTCFIQHILSL